MQFLKLLFIMEEYNTNINSERKCYIILTVGIPGIGKSTF